MSAQKREEYFIKMQTDYMRCLKETISIALYSEWGNDWFKKLQEIDHENTLTHNNREKNKVSKAAEDGSNLKPHYIADITDKFDNLSEFDFQACNKVIYHLEEIRSLVFKNRGKENLAGKYRKYFNTLIEFRNKYQGHLSHEKTDFEETEKAYENAIATMHLLLKDIFSGIVNEKDPAHRYYLHTFEDARMGFQIESRKKLYVLSEYLDFGKYDLTQFMDQCTKLGIEANMIEGKYVFYSANLETDLSKLKNALAISSDKPMQPIMKTSESTSSFGKWALLTVGILLVIILTFLLIFLFTSQGSNERKKDPTSVSENTANTANPNSTNDQSEDVLGSFSLGENSDADKSQDESFSAENEPPVQMPIGEDEASAEYGDKIKAFQYQDEGSVNLNTIRIAKGGLSTPPAATVWTNCKVLSQNTAVAIGEGCMVKGVAKGETYIVLIGGTGISQVYRVIVE